MNKHNVALKQDPENNQWDEIINKGKVYLFL